MRAAWVIATVCAGGCARLAGLDDVRAAADAAADATGDAEEPPACTGITATPPDEGAAHVTDESPISWNANPPASGTHYPDWTRWQQAYPTAIKRGYWVHNLEHGGIVFLYNCTDCQPDIDRLIAIMNNMAHDPDCQTPIVRRAIVTPDPLLPSGATFAAVAWGHSYVASCVNGPELRAFAAAHARGGPENTNCDEGQYPP